MGVRTRREGQGFAAMEKPCLGGPEKGAGARSCLEKPLCVLHKANRTFVERASRQGGDQAKKSRS